MLVGQPGVARWSSGQRAAVQAAARAHAFDRYLAALLAPRGQRDDLMVLGAFLGDVARIPLTVREPMLAEIRLQWWRDCLASHTPAVKTGSPLADCLLETIDRRHLAREPFAAIVDAAGMLLPPEGLGDRWMDYLDAGDVNAARLSANLAGADARDWREGLDASARAYGLCRLLIDLPYYQAIGRDPIASGNDRRSASELLRQARHQLAIARDRLSGAPREIVMAALPAALVGPYLRALEESRVDAPHDVRAITPLSRVWNLWRARWRGAL